jgi:hypothetical protein
MRKNKLLCLFLGISVIAISQTATPPAGTGTAADPYQIATLLDVSMAGFLFTGTGSIYTEPDTKI